MATRKPKAEQTAGSYIVQSPLDHDGERYAPGDSVELSEDQAKPLLEAKVISPAAAT